MLNNSYFGKALQNIVVLLLFVVIGCSSSLSPEDGLQRAEEYKNKGDYKAAIIELKNVLINSPQHSATRLMLGELYLLQRNGHNAATQLRKANEYGQGLIDIRSSMGKALLLQKEFDQLLKVVIVEEYDTSDVRLNLLTLRAFAHFFKHNFERADHAFIKASEIDDKYPATMVGRALIMLENKNHEKSAQLIKQALAVDNTNMDAWIAKGMLALNKRLYGLAEEAFSSAIRSTKNDFTYLHPDQSHIYLVRTLVDQGKINDAKQALKKFANTNTKSPIIHFLRALIAYESGEYVAASEHIQITRSLAPNYDAALMLEGAIYYALGRLESGNSALTNYLTRHPNSTSARKLLAATRLKLQQPQQAYELILPMLEQEPDNIQLLLLAGDAMRNAGKPEASISMIEKALEQEPENRELKMQLASARLANGETDEAISVLQTVTPTKDRFGKRELLLLLAWSSKEDYVAALEFVDKYIAAHPDDSDVLGHSGVLLLRMEKTDQARERFEKALSLKPNNIQVLMTLVRLEHKQKQYSRAEELLRRLDKIEPGNASVLYALANISALQGKKNITVTWLEKSAAASDSVLEPRVVLAKYYLEKGDLTRARKVISEAKTIAPGRADVWNTYSMVMNDLGDKVGAIESMRKAEKLAPDSEVILMNLSKLQMSIKDIDGATKTLHKLIKLSPENFNVASILALTEIKQGNTKLAIEIAQKQQASEKNRLNALALEGDLHMLAKNYSKAVDVYRASIAISPSAALTAKLYFALRRTDSSDEEALLLDWLINNPGDKTIRLLLANHYIATGVVAKGIEEYETLVVQMPDNPDVFNNLALAYYSLQNSKALQTAEKAHKLSAENAAIKDTLGWILIHENDVKRGAKLLQEAASELPNNAEVNYHYAVALNKSGDKDKSRSLLQKLVATNGNSAVLEKAKEYLQTLVP